ncbi:MAG: insulinase family protein [Acidobacteria bacterium]|nr:insulinase family protein [Acidobacteriota bacterium]MBI3426809.1 insulinase family protein [Acidobacteriota bacterium]
MLKRFATIILIALFTAPNLPAQTAGLKLPPFKKAKLKNGLTVLLLEQHDLPLISFSFIVKAGSTADPAGKEGVAALTASLLRKGTKMRNADQIAADLDFIGAQFFGNAGLDFTSGRAEFVKKDLAQGLEIFSDCLLNSAFPPAEVEKLLKQNIDGLKSAKDQAQGVIGEYFNAYLYGAHPYARPTSGDEKSLAALTRDDIAKFYESYYTPSNTIMVVAGDFNTAEMESLLGSKFGAWPNKQAPTVNLPEPQPVAGKKLLLVDKPDATQTYYQIGNVGIARSNADRVYIGVINTLFGGRFTSMLNDALRVSSGLTYGASARFEQRKARGPFVISTYTRNATTEKAIDLTLEILNRLHTQGVSEKDLQSAKNYIKGQFPPTIETSDQLANLLASLEFYGLDERDINDYYKQIDAMTLADAQRVIKQYYPLDNLVFVLIGKASEIESVAKKYAPKLDTKNISQPGF